MLAAYGIAPPLALAILPGWILAGVLVALGTNLWLSALNVLYRDVRYALPFMLQVWLYASPVVFPSSLFGGVERWFYALNPVVGIIDGFRWSLLGAPAPPAADLVSAGVALVLLVTGVIYFRRVEKHFADQI
jgi:lipopolysaccharide transport system permease protein